MNFDVIFVMGVSGCGKTTVGRQLAARLGYTYIDGDDFHSESNLTKMKSGKPLNDDDRMPWLQSINEYCRTHKNIVVGCSALRSRYRNVLRTDIHCRFIFLNVTRKLLETRLRNRVNHFMPSSLLDSQLATIEDPTNEKDVVSITIQEETPDLIERILEHLLDSC